MPATTRPSVTEIRAAIADDLTCPGLTIEAVAASLFTSRSQIQRALTEAGTYFTAELQEARRTKALKMLVRKRATVQQTAAAVGVSPDHLRVLLKPVIGMPPGHLRRAVTLHDRFRTWRRRLPPEYGSYLYRQRRIAWRRSRKELVRLLEVIPANSELRPWADHALRISQRPDYRRQPYRTEVRQAREQAAARDTLSLQTALARAGWPTFDDTVGVRHAEDDDSPLARVSV